MSRLKHPALKMSNVRKDLWLKEATQQDYFEMVDLLKALYAKKVYNDAHANRQYSYQYQEDAFDRDYAKRDVAGDIDVPTKTGEPEDELHSW